jgi:hypothetical protein
MAMVQTIVVVFFEFDLKTLILVRTTGAAGTGTEFQVAHADNTLGTSLNCRTT